jgi:hypothetical protein
MGKIFSIEIDYNVYKHHALVSVLDFEGGPFFHIQLFDPFLMDTFQVEHIRYTGINGYRYGDWYDDAVSSSIMDRIARAIEKELSYESIPVRWRLGWEKT